MGKAAGASSGVVCVCADGQRNGGTDRAWARVKTGDRPRSKQAPGREGRASARSGPGWEQGRNRALRRPRGRQGQPRRG